MNVEIIGVMALIVGMCSLVAGGIMIGIFAERVKWNKLIEDGFLPKPGEYRKEV